MNGVNDVRIGVLGLGTVGAGVVKILQTRAALLQERTGARLSLAAIADTDLTRPREALDLAALPMTGDAARACWPTRRSTWWSSWSAASSPRAPSSCGALTAGKHVVTANKALLAHHGAELYEEARRRGVALGFEAAVAGRHPADPRGQGRPGRQPGAVAGRHRQRHLQLHPEQDDRRGARLLAGPQGERRPTATPRPIPRSTSRGWTRRTSCRSWPRWPSARTSISRTSTPRASPASPPRTSSTRAELGFRIKLLAIAKVSGEGGGVEVRVHPTMIPAASPLAAVSGVFNGIFMTGDAVGDLMFYGRGAGQMPTASAVVSDVVEIARRIAHGLPSLALDLPSVGPTPLPLTPMEAIRCCYYLRVTAQDRPGVLSRVAGHPRRERHLDLERHPEGPRHARGGAGGDADPRGTRARHARRAGEDRPAA